jgi:YVTN family beta-propeller protein
MIFKSIEGWVKIMNRWKMLVSVLVLCFFMTSVAFSEDASKHMDHQKPLKSHAKPKSPVSRQSTTALLGLLGLGYSGLTSSSTVTIGTGSKTFVTNLASTGTAFAVGDRVRVIYTTTPTNYMEGLITSFTRTTLTVNVDHVGGSGIYKSWSISLTGDVGLKGDKGDQGSQGVAGPAGQQGLKGDTGATGPMLTIGSTIPIATPYWTAANSPVPLSFNIPRGPFAYIANSGDNTVSIIDTTTNTVTGAPVPVGQNPNGVAVSPDGTKVYVANSGDNTVSIIDATTNTPPVTVAVGHQPEGISVSPDGTKVYVANSGDNTVSIIDATTNAPPVAVAAGPQPEGIAVSPDGTKVYVANSGDNTVSIIKIIANRPSAPVTVAVGHQPEGIAVSPDGTKVYVANSGDNTVSIIDATTNTPPVAVAVGHQPEGIAISPDGTKVYVANSGDNTVSIIDATTNTPPVAVAVGHQPEGIAVSPDGTKVYVANSGDNTVSIIDATTNTPPVAVAVGQIPFSMGQFIGPAISPPPTAAPHDGYLYINFVDISNEANLPIGKLYISTDSTNPKATGYVEVNIRSASLIVPVKQESYCFMTSTTQPKNYALYYQPLVPQGTGG